jgi:hypothetical protein
VTLWDIESGRPTTTFHAREFIPGSLRHYISGLEFDPTGTRLKASVHAGGWPGREIVWDFPPP